MRKRQPIVPLRTWVATITFDGDAAGYREITTMLHGHNPTEAETNYRREHQDVAGIVIHQESRQ